MSFRTSVVACSLAVAGGLLLGFASPAGATVWQPVHTTLKSQTEIDLDSISKKEGVATAWMQQVQADPVASKSGAYFVYRTLKTRVRFQCVQHSITIMSRAYYSDAGVEVAAERQAEEARGVVPETLEERAMAIACAADPRKAASAMRKPETIPARYMDGPVPIERRPGLVQASVPSTDAHAPETPAAKRAEVPKATHEAHAAPAAPKTVLPSLPLASAAHGPAVPARESRQKVVERVMRERGIAKPAVIGALASPGHEEAHWDYVGENAPYRWGDMKNDFATCKNGQRQSPIDIRHPVVSEMEPIVFHYEESPLKVLNNGHTIQVEFAAGSFILHGGARYELLQMHFHTPSEERINGRSFAMVAHLVHKSAQGKLAVVAVLLDAGATHPAIETIWNTMPGTAGRTRERPEMAFNPMSVLPADRNFYSFQGSLTTPPCTEGVQWLVMKTPVELGREQIAHFSALYPMNARPIQPVNDRVIKAGR
jgi:carbonic anhydrase